MLSVQEMILVLVGILELNWVVDRICKAFEHNATTVAFTKAVSTDELEEIFKLSKGKMEDDTAK